jgi:protein phosphatase
MERLVAAVRCANEAILEAARAHRELEGMGCTLVASVVAGETLHTCHLGDARCYVADANRISQVSRDHSLVVELREAGTIGDEDLRSHPMRNAVTRALGLPMEEPPEYTKADLRRETRVLLCSDGLWGLVDDAEIHRILMAATAPPEACDALVDRANLLGGTDNITALVGFRQS